MAPNARGKSFGVRASAEHRLDLSVAPVRVIVGKAPNERVFFISEDLLYQHSIALELEIDQNSGKEDKTLREKYLDPEAFDMFANFLYTGKVHSYVYSDEVLAKDTPFHHEEWDRLIKGWILGTSLWSASFKDAVVDAICEKMVQDKTYYTTLWTHAYRYTSPGSPLRRLAVDIGVWGWVDFPEDHESYRERWIEFQRDLVRRGREISPEERARGAPYKRPSCRYHEHSECEDGEDYPCYRTMF